MGNTDRNKEFGRIGFAPADIMLPADCEWEKWAVVACDQFTSQPEYWERVEEAAGDSVSTFRLILPEMYLSGGNTEERIKGIHNAMDQYIQEGVFRTYEDSFIYLERVQSDGRIRHGIIGMVDLECYDYNKGSTSLIRATEGTVLERIPPRQAVRREASIELPHVMLLIDDPDNTVIGPLAECREDCLYDFDLMEGGGHASAYLVPDDQKKGISDALNKLLDASSDSQLLFAVGDGNHSLATAKACYEELKQEIGSEAAAVHPARWALAEIVNLYDDALSFEPIHRVMFDVDPTKVLEGLRNFYTDHKEGADEAGHVIEYVTQEGNGFITIMGSDSNLPVGTLQKFIDDYLQNNSGSVDYIHDEVARDFGARPGCIAFMLPPMEKHCLFESIVSDGALPRKTFSMGHAEDKRYYIEARKIR